MAKIACVAVVKNEERHIAEWVAWQFLAGFDTVVLMDNGSTDATVARAQMLGSGYDLRILASPDAGESYQISAYFRAIANFGAEFDWMAFFDADEFLVLDGEDRIGQVLARHVDATAVAVSWAMFGSSGHQNAPPGLTIEAFQWRSAASFPPNRHIKSIIRPARVRGIVNGHMFNADTAYIDLAGRPVTWESPGIIAAAPDYAGGKLHHYFTRSREDWLAKLARGYPDLVRRQEEFEVYDRNEILDTSATRQAAALQALLAQTAPKIRPVLQRPGEFGLRSVAADEYTTPVPLSGFAQGRDVHAEIYPPAEMELTAACWLNMGENSVRFCGPDFRQPVGGPWQVGFPTRVRAPRLTISRITDVLYLPGQIAIAGAAQGWTTILAESFNSYWDRVSHHGIRPEADGLFALRSAPGEVARRPGKYLFCDNQHRGHFGHIMTDVVSLAWAYHMLVLLGITDLQVLVFDAAFNLLRDFLTAAGIPADRLVSSSGGMVVEEMFFATKCYLTQGYTSAIAVETWRQVRDFLVPDDRASGGLPERVYLSRRNIAGRPLVNEDAAIAIFAARGFAVIEPGSLPLAEQIRLVSHASHLAGPSGSNMFHLAFQRRASRAMILISPNLIHFSEHFLNAGHGARLSYFLGASLAEEVHAPWQVDCLSLERAVDAWLEG